MPTSLSDKYLVPAQILCGVCKMQLQNAIALGDLQLSWLH